MLNRSISILMITSIFCVSLVIPVFGQSQQTKQEKQTVKVKDKIGELGTGPKAKVKAKLYNGTTYQGYVSEANSDNFVVTDKSGGQNPIKYSDVKSIGGKSLPTGAKIAVGIAIGAGAVLLIVAALIAKND